MPSISVIDHTGQRRTFEAQTQVSLMQNLRDAGFGEIIALCGGMKVCATCQVYVDPAWLRAVGEPDEDEADLLKETGIGRPNSRLSCQILVEDGMDGLLVELPSE